MSINRSKRQSLAKRAVTAALVSGSMALAGLGMTAGTAQAQPSAPIPQTWGYQYCSWAWWDWEHCHYYWDWHNWDWKHHDHHDDHH
ncbi:hypothetical protein ACNO8X_09265 [Mycobacterium sp. PDNC021]|uniref:hypothetical protein n=1 Tax=Mycobacterium sp. PDNC021 TaxID=3391399 RepID=UPI003AADBE0B